MRLPFVGLAAVIGLAGCAAEEKPRAEATPAIPHVALDRVEVGESDAGTQVWGATADRAVYRTAAKEAELTAVKARFYEDGRVVTEGAAPRAVWRQDAHDIALSGGVALRTSNGQGRVAADGARWDAAAGRLLVDGEVRFAQGANRLVARRLRGDRALRRVELSEGVRGTFALGSGTIALWSGSKQP